MQHLTRWRTVTAAAATTALAFGALGIAGAITGDDQPAAIELAADEANDAADLKLAELSTDSPASAASVTASQVSATSDSPTQQSVSASSVRSLDSRDEEVRAAATQQEDRVVTRDASPNSPDSGPSPVSAPSPNSPASPNSPSSPDSPASMDSVSSVSS